jgi:hypothetical protein
MEKLLRAAVLETDGLLKEASPVDYRQVSRLAGPLAKMQRHCKVCRLAIIAGNQYQPPRRMGYRPRAPRQSPQRA